MNLISAMKKILPGWYWTLVFSLFALGIGLLVPSFIDQFWQRNSAVSQPDTITVTPYPTQQVTSTPMEVAQAASATSVSATATNTLLPPPTLEPPTATPFPSMTPTVTPTQSIFVNVTIEGIQGLPTATLLPEEAACEARDDWSLEYTVQDNETLTSIANKFDTWAQTLAEGNCIADVNVIRAGQPILVPGDSIPVEPAIVCEGYTLLQPINNAAGIPSTGTITFNWKGPRAPRYLLRLYPPDYDFSTENSDEWIDYTFDLRQNNSLDLTDLPDGGLWHWEVRPLDEDFVQACPGSPLWSFNKDEYDPSGEGLGFGG
ncbi:MAG: LysM peptidoglycan-binding domain-containing protein [Anaerolineae bacterium]|nr:LysM peptidoglycan-binding domain-containing protein [Anaerolineae bacterium]MCA9895864.1 LysM peptidoglycan-binding domain-containing protein [Anaerolineae bacterium]